jgi:hypothetical protein
MPSNRMLIVAHRGRFVEVDVKTTDARSLIGKHHNAIRRYLETGDDEPLRQFRTKRLRLGGQIYELETDLETIEDIAHAGDLGYEDIYVLG